MPSRARREHPLRAILRIAETSLRAADLASRELWRVDPSWSCAEAHARMATLDFDVAPLDEEPLQRYVLRAELAGASDSPGEPVERRAHPIDATHLVTSDLGLAEALDLLRDRSFLFVIEGGGVAGIITPSDLQRVPVSMVVLSLILAAEAGMDQLILAHYGEEGWLDHLSEERRGRLEERYADLVRRNLETTRLELLMLEDRLRLVGRVGRYREALGFRTRKAFESRAEHLKRVRDALAHGRNLLDVEPDGRRALDRVREIHVFAQRVWDAVESSTVPAFGATPTLVTPSRDTWTR